MVEAGVIGYAIYEERPPATRPSPIASLPERRLCAGPGIADIGRVVRIWSYALRATRLFSSAFGMCRRNTSLTISHGIPADFAKAPIIAEFAVIGGAVSSLRMVFMETVWPL